jgi:bifunctional UDP-N-acetylglucosamine pyrophosphorylase/glucosamine-1-phosphate N-acetyltransferase
MATIVNSRLMDGVVVEQSVVEQSVIGSHARVGPYSHLRPGTYLDRDVKIGNFVELKNTRVGIGSKAGHHSYLGDATIGGRVNIGAGTVIVNFDGTTKHQTFIGDEAFIGCNSNLVAPIEIGPGAYVAAGSTLTQNVPGDALAIARGRQENKPGWAKARRSRRHEP